MLCKTLESNKSLTCLPPSKQVIADIRPMAHKRGGYGREQGIPYTIEVVNSRLAPTYESELLENTVPTREPSPECCGLLQLAIAKLPLKLKEVFLQLP